MSSERRGWCYGAAMRWIAIRSAALLAACAGLSGCGRQADNQPGPGGVTVGEAKALDEAAEMLEKRRMPPEALRAPGSPAATASAAP